MDLDYQLIVRDDPKSPPAEAIRSLRTNLQFVGLDKPLKSVLVTSAGPSEGKTSIAGNLAYSLAQSGMRTIAVGVDLRKPSIHKVYGVGNAVGLTNVLLGRSTLDDALQETDNDHLQVLSSGPVPPNPAELLGSRAMRELIAELDQRADIVVYDSTPIVAVTDAAVLAPAVDGVLLVVAMKQTPREVVRQAKEQLQQVKANIVGVVLNRVEIKGSGSYYYYYYGRSNKEAAASSDSERPVERKPRHTGVLARLFGRS